MNYEDLSPELKEKAKACKTPEDILALAKEEGIAEDGYRLIMNCNKHGGQEVFHIHMHLVGGEPLGRMLGK